MKIFAIGEPRRLKELREKLGSSHDLEIAANENRPDPADLQSFNLIIDLNLDNCPERLSAYSLLEGKMVVGCAVKSSLNRLAFDNRHELKCILVGMNLLPDFINRPLMEVSFRNANDAKLFDEVAKELQWKYTVVEDRVGMITPRVIGMIINEACFTLQEGTASMADIDMGMRLGTNYPYGPFEWCDRIGIRDVYQTLEAIRTDTGDERYKICPLLKSKYLRNEMFYG